MSTPPPQAPRSPRRDKQINRWHRSAGIAAAGVLVYLLVTGIPLQFTAELRLGQRYLAVDWILDWYGLEAPRRVLQSGNVTQVGDQLMIAGRALTTLPTLVGAVQHGPFTVVAAGDQVMIWHEMAPDTVERVALGGAVLRIGKAAETVYLDMGSDLLAADAMLLAWSPASAPTSPIRWSGVATVTGIEADEHRRRFRGRMLTVERCLQDLHSGRFFGPLGVIVIDLASVLLLVLAFTGTVMWWRFRRSRGGCTRA